MPFEIDSVDRRIVSQVLQRQFRDRAFSVAIKAAYKDTCAVTGLKLINGGGRSEVQAALSARWCMAAGLTVFAMGWRCLELHTGFSIAA